MQVFDELFSYEERNSAGRLPRKNRFVKNKTWYVNENYMGKIFAYPMLSQENKMPGLHRTKVLGLVKNFVAYRKVRELFPSTADAIQIKRTGERLRAFYLTGREHRYTLKVVCDSDRRKLVEALKREVAVRERLTSLGTINIPKVLAAEQRGDAFLLCEEIIFGRRFNARIDRTLYRESLLPQLRNTYLAYGVQYVPIHDFLSPDMSREVDRLLDEKGVGKQFREALRNVTEKNPLAAVSLCHGGLGPCNLAIANGKVYFLDWKWANEGLIISDLLRTAVKYPKLTYILKNIREVVTSDFMDNGCSFEEMVTVGIAREIHRGPGRIPKLLHIWQHCVF